MGLGLSNDELIEKWYEYWYECNEMRKDIARELKRRADRGDAACQVAYGHVLVRETLYADGPWSEYDECLRYFMKAAERGDAAGLQGIVEYLVTSMGQDSDFEKIAKLSKLAVDQGNDDAKSDYGICLSNGLGVEKDMQKAAEYFKFFADKREIWATGDFGFCLENGLGVAQDLDQALRYYRKGSFYCSCDYHAWRAFNRCVNEKWKGFAGKPLFELIVDFELFREVRNLGKGGFGFTTVVTNEKNEEFCVKHYEYHQAKSCSYDMARWLDVLLRIQHPCIIRHMGWEFPEAESQEWRILSCYYKNGSLEDVLKKIRNGEKGSESLLTHEVISIFSCLLRYSYRVLSSVWLLG
jgi:hypothetical protein